MKTDLRRFAPLGLVLSLLAVLSFIGILIIKGLAAGNMFTIPDPKVLDQALWISLGVVIFGLALTTFFDPDGARKFFVGRQVQYGSNALLMLVAFVGVVFFINLLVYQSSSTSTPWDWTADKQNTLAPETINILKALKAPVTVRAYYISPDETIQTLLMGFKQNSDGKFTYEFLDPNSDPVKASNDGITHDQTVVLVMGTHKENVEYASEQELDAAIIRLTSPVQAAVYFLTGHGERDIEASSESSITQVSALLKSKNYNVKTLSLIDQNAVPADAKALVIAGPQKPLTEAEVKIVEDYLSKGGSVIIMEDPRQFTKFGDAPDPLADMIKKWGISYQDDILLDSNTSTGYLVQADQTNFANHPITAKLQGYPVGYYTAQSIKISETPPSPEIQLTPLTQSLANGVWGETDFKSLEDKKPTLDATDIQAPLTLAAIAENTTSKARLVVFGDSDFASDGLSQKLPGLSDILINTIDWSTKQENLISLTPKNNVNRTFQPPSTLETIASVLTALCIIPLVIIFAGVLAWFSRRRRG